MTKNGLIPTRSQWKTWSLPSRLTAIGALLGLVGVLLTVAFQLFPTSTKEAMPPAVSNKHSVALPPNDLLKKLEPGSSMRSIEEFLGIPTYESGAHRNYEAYGYLVRIEVASDGTSVLSSEIGPAAGESGESVLPFPIAGAWGSVQKPFGLATLQDFDGCNLSDWTWGANGACFNVFELTCSASHATNWLQVSAGINGVGCYSLSGTEMVYPSDLPKTTNGLTSVVDGDRIRELAASNLAEALAEIGPRPINYLRVERRF